MTDVTTPTVSIEIDGQALKVPQGSMIIEAADNAGITIPRFCYHKKLTIAANCRMCLVDVENSRKPTPACATPVTEGMKVLTKSKKAIQYQKSVMEFLLINHPLDCPICDQGGECELQDLSVGYGKDVSRYNQGKRVVADKDIGPLVATDLTRCIHCTRCVRFGAEIAGERELGMTGRGEHSQIASFLSKPLESELSGNIIDLCPVGALTSKPFRYQARAWELQQKPTIAAHDCVGSNLFAHVRRGEVMRVAPRENEALNEVWLSDRDRFSYQGVNSTERLKKPMMKRNGEWVAVSWGEAFDYAVQFLRRSLEKDGAEQIGGLASAHCTTEELYLFQKLLRDLGCRNLDYRLRRKDFSHDNQEAGLPGINASLAEIEAADVVVLIGANIRKEQPIIHHRIRQASLDGAQVFAINPAAFDFRVENLSQQVSNIDELPLALAGLLKALLAKATDKNSLRMDTESLLARVEVSAETQHMADALLAAKQPVILSGAFVKHHPNAGLLFHLLGLVMDVAKARGGQLTDGPNSAGATLAGMLPHRGAAGKQERPAGLNAAEMLASHRALKTYLLLNVEPGLDSAYGQRALENLEKADWVLALNPFMTPELMQYADMVLPIGTVFETSGTFINVLGQWQSFQGVATPVGEARPAWKVLRVLANFLELSGFGYESSEEVLAELQGLVAKQTSKAATIIVPKSLPEKQTLLKRVAEVPMYATDSLVRHASALQQTVEMQQQLRVSLSPQLAKQLDLAEGDKALIQQNNGTSLVLPVHVQAGLPDKSVWVPMGLPEVARLGEAFDQISVMRV